MHPGDTNLAILVSSCQATGEYICSSKASSILALLKLQCCKQKCLQKVEWDISARTFCLQSFKDKCEHLIALLWFVICWLLIGFFNIFLTIPGIQIAGTSILHHFSTLTFGGYRFGGKKTLKLQVFKIVTNLKKKMYFAEF